MATFPHRAYLQSLDMGKVLMSRVSRVWDFYNAILPERLDDIFVNDYVNDDGTRTYGSAWLFSPTFMAEVRDWQTTDDFDLLRPSRIRYWRLRKENFEFGEEPTAASRCALEFGTLTNSGALTAAGDNCSRLHQIFIKYINVDLGES